MKHLKAIVTFSIAGALTAGVALLLADSRVPASFPGAPAFVLPGQFVTLPPTHDMNSIYYPLRKACPASDGWLWGDEDDTDYSDILCIKKPWTFRIRYHSSTDLSNLIVDHSW